MSVYYDTNTQGRWYRPTLLDNGPAGYDPAQYAAMNDAYIRSASVVPQYYKGLYDVGEHTGYKLLDPTVGIGQAGDGTTPGDSGGGSGDGAGPSGPLPDPSGGGVNSPAPSGGSRDNGDGRMGGSAEPGMGAGFNQVGLEGGGGLGSLGSLSGFGDAVNGLFSGGMLGDYFNGSNLLGYDPITPELMLGGGLLGMATGLPLGTMGAIGGSYLDRNAASSAATQLTDPYGSIGYQPDIGYFSGLANNLSLGLFGDSYEDQALDSTRQAMEQYGALGMANPEEAAAVQQAIQNAYSQPTMTPTTPEEMALVEATQPTQSFDQNMSAMTDLASQIQGLQAQLGSLDPDTAGYGRTQNQIESLSRELSALSSGYTADQLSSYGLLDTITDAAFAGGNLGGAYEGGGGYDSSRDRDLNRESMAATGERTSQRGGMGGV